MFPWESMCLAGLTGLGLTVVGMPAFLGWAQGHGWGQRIRGEGPKDHLSKSGTPTMGGLVLITAGLAASFWAGGHSWDMLVFRLVVVLCAILGMVDDLSKILHNQSLGLKARHKLLAQGLLGLALGAWLCLTRENLGVSIPLVGFVGGAWIVWVTSVLVTAGAVNAVNLTDGLDGLAGSTCASSLLAFALVCCGSNDPGLGVAATGFAGACLGFLWHNSYPARVFMGDTGSLGLGGALAALALLTGNEFLLVLIGGVFVMEALSVIIQVTYFKLTGGKRIFRMSPIHHHFELRGMHEVQVTARFALISLMLAIVGCLVFFGAL